MVPEDIVVRSVSAEPPGFHARFSAIARRYSYRLLETRDPLLRHTHYQLPGAPLDMEAVRRASRALVGEYDYSSFCKAVSLETGKSICRVRRADWSREGSAWVFQIQSDRFLHSMVRSIVGTLVEIGRGQRPPDAIPAILEARRREAAGHLAPAHGLCLEEVEYGERPDPRDQGDPS
jgi:tRNA pseudouridine38-40 synthase